MMVNVDPTRIGALGKGAAPCRGADDADTQRGGPRRQKAAAADVRVQPRSAAGAAE
jgi:hypothetical protein